MSARLCLYRGSFRIAAENCEDLRNSGPRDLETSRTRELESSVCRPCAYRSRLMPEEADEDHRSGRGAEEHLFDHDPLQSGRALF